MDISEKYRNKVLDYEAKAELQMKRVFLQYVRNVTKHLDDPALRFSSSFVMSKNEKLGAVLSGDAYKEFQQGAYEVTKDVVTGSWNLAGAKHNEAYSDYLTLLRNFTGNPEYSFDVNRKALNAFIRGQETGSLSAKVWKTTRQFRDEMAVHMGMGIANGDSAATISRRVRQYLDKPDALFRRNKFLKTDSEGNIVEKFRWSKRAKNYNPGRGVYRSAYKNAMRVTRTATNQAYWLSDQHMWRGHKFVLGYTVKLSANHPEYDICDELKGEYPKDFVFSGWHPQCFCNAVAILMPPDKFKKYLSGQSVRTKKVGLPNNFKRWTLDNAEKVNGMKKKPYFIRDNIEKVTEDGFVFNGKSFNK